MSNLPPAAIVAPATKTEARRQPLSREKLPPLINEKVTLANWYKFVIWKHVIFFTLMPTLALYGFYTTEIQLKTAIWVCVYYSANILTITSGYHRMWSHHAYTSTPFLNLLFAIFGAGAFQGSIHNWVRDHRAHHRWTDTDKDPYNAQRGFWWSHIGWLLIRRPGWKVGYSDMQDIENDSLIQWQHRNYLWLGILMALVFPMTFAGLCWGDWRGGFFFGTCLRMTMVHQSAFSINSLTHWIGDTPYDDYHSPRNNWLVGIVTMGEGYHNFHHQFPMDYRNAIRWYQVDATKWLINIFVWLKLAKDLKRFPENEIQKAEIEMAEQKLLNKKSKLKWGRPIKDLPVISFEGYQHACQEEGKEWILLEGIVYEIPNGFDHPGGRKYLKMGIGKDMTSAFNGGIYSHSNSARNLLSTMRVAVVEYGGEVESQKKNPSVPVYI